MWAGCRLRPDDPYGLTHRLGTGAGLARGARAGPRLHLWPLTSSCFVLSMLSLVLPELWPEPEWQLGPKRERAEGPVLFKASPKLARSHFCCLLLVRAFTEPTHFHETPPADGRGFGDEWERMLVAIFAGSPRSSRPASWWPGAASDRTSLL